MCNVIYMYVCIGVVNHMDQVIHVYIYIPYSAYISRVKFSRIAVFENFVEVIS